MSALKVTRAAVFSFALLGAGTSLATSFTSNSPLGVDVTSVGASTIGGIVVDLVGTNGNHVVSQLPATSLLVGSPSAAQYPITIGGQTGFTSSITGSLGGGLSGAAFRFSLFDGDNAANNFDFNENRLLVNNIDFGNWSTVNAQNTDGVGNAGSLGFSNGGFRNDTLDTGWFVSNNTSQLAGLFSSLTSTGTLTFGLQDASPGDQFYDFTQGLNTSVTNVGRGPAVTPPQGGQAGAGVIPEPQSAALLGLGLVGLLATRFRAASEKFKRRSVSDDV